MKTIAVVGYPGVGKSTVSKLLEKRGALHINLDKIVHGLYEPRALGTQKIEAFFGPDYLKKDGSVNRPKLKKAVFNNPQKLRILESFIHPFVLHEVKLQLEKASEDLRVIEMTVYRRDAKINDLIDKWVLVNNSRVKLNEVNGYDLSEFHQDLSELKPDFIIENEGSIENLEGKILDLQVIL